MASCKWREGRFLLYFQSKHHGLWENFDICTSVDQCEKNYNLLCRIFRPDRPFVPTVALQWTTYVISGETEMASQHLNPLFLAVTFWCFSRSWTIRWNQSIKYILLIPSKSCEICEVWLIQPCAVFVRRVCGWSVGWSKRREDLSFLLHTYGAARPFCFDFRGFRL